MRATALAVATLLLAPVVSAQDADRTVDSKFDKMGNAFMLKVGPAAIYWNDANTASGDYSVKASFSEAAMKAQHPHSYGVFIGGNALDDDNTQTFAYCIVYGTGKYSVKYFNGLKVTSVAEMVEHPAITKADGQGNATNEVGWRVKGGNATCVVNGQDVKSLTAAELVGAGKLASTNGIYGYRVSHNLDLHVTPLAVSK
jgi:hypothetical protein